MVYRILISSILLGLFLDSAPAQWKQSAPNLLGNIPSDKAGFGSIAFRGGTTWAGRNELWMSSDTGRTWTQSLGTFGGTITQIEFFDRDNGLVSAIGGIYKTNDHGATWKLIHKGGDCYSVSFCGSIQQIIASCDYAGVFYSIDGGNSWSSGNPGGHILGCIGRTDGSALVHSGSNVTQTTDQGRSWQTLGTVDYDSFTFGIDSSGINNVYLLNEEGHVKSDNSASIFRSSDGGLSWTDVGKQPGTFFTGSLSLTRNALYAQTLAEGVFRSTDKGSTWQSICGPSNFIDTRLLCAVSDEIIIAADGQGSVWRADMGPGSGKLEFYISSKRVVSDSTDVVVTLPIYLKCKTTMPSFDMVMHYPGIPLTYLKSESPSGKSLDVPGGNWKSRVKLHFEAADLATRKDSLIGYASFKWFPYEYDCARITFDSIVADLVENPCTGKTTVVDSATETWIGSYPGCGIAFEADVDAPSFILGKGSNSFTDTLTVDDGRLTDEGLRSIRWAPQKGTDTNKIKVLGIVPPISPCFTDKVSHSIEIVQLDSSVAGCYNFTFTDCIGHQSFTTICVTTRTLSTSDYNNENLFTLEANRPNPFSESTNFSYTLNRSARTKLILFDELGREVARLVDGIETEGRHELNFDGSKLASGNYIVRLESGTKALSRRLMIIR
ncbi:MAG: T9SS type A sorting domain-containing protein [Ignavibacteriota bacterium]